MSPSDLAPTTEQALVKRFSTLRQAVFGDWLMRFSSGARRNGATAATLQVEAGNMPGRTRYRSVSMVTEFLWYHYRREPRARGDATRRRSREIPGRGK